MLPNVVYYRDDKKREKRITFVCKANRSDRESAIHREMVKKPACYSVLLLPVANFIVDSTTDGYGVHIYMLEMCVLMRLEDELTDEKGKTS